MNIVQHIPTKPAEFPPNSFVLYGQPKIGKSDLFSKMPGVLYINLEDGLHHVAADITPPPGKPVKTIDELKTLIAEIAAGLANGSLKYRAVVLDGLSTFLVKIGIGLKKSDARQVAKELSVKLVPVLEAYFALPCIRIVTLHSRSGTYEKSWKTQEDGHDKKFTVTVTTEAPDLSPRVRQFLDGMADAIGYCHTFNNKPTVQWIEINTKDSLNPYEAHMHIVAGNRLGLPQSTELSLAAITKLLTSATSSTISSLSTRDKIVAGNQKPAQPAPVATAPAAAAAPERKADPVTGEVMAPDDKPWCQWCGEHPSAPGVPCASCQQLGATPESLPSLAGRTKTPTSAPKPALKPLPAPQAPPAPTNGHNKMAKLVGITGQTYTEWKRLCMQLANAYPIYATPMGQPNNFQILSDAKLCNYSEIKPDNMGTVIEALQLRAKALQADEAPF